MQMRDQLLALAADAQARRLELVLGQLCRQALVEAEVEERDAAVGEQHEVAGVGVTGELVVAVHAAEVEAEDDLGDAVARGGVGELELLEAGAADEFAHHHALARERSDDLGDVDEGVAAEDPRHRALVGRLELVVELLVDPQADLLARSPARRAPAPSARAGA